MLHYVDGDLLESDCTVIMHQANCLGIMGGGIAKAIAEKHPLAYQADKSCNYSPEHKYGRYSLAKLPNGLTIFNLYGQLGLGRAKREEQNERMRMLESALHEAFHLLNSNAGLGIDNSKVGLPYGIACGLAGGDWSKVEPILKRVSDVHGIDIYLYKL